MRKVKFRNTNIGRIVDYNQFYEVKQLEGSEFEDVFKNLFYIFPTIQRSPSSYMAFMIDYLTYAVNRDELKDVFISYSTKLDKYTNAQCSPTRYESDPDVSLISLSARNPLFKKFEGYENFFNAINSIEHEITHLYDFENWPYGYHKFENENGRFKTSYNVSFIEVLFSDTPFEKITNRWLRAIYYNNHMEYFARQRAQVCTAQFFECLKELYSDQKNWQEIEEGFKKYEENTNYLNEKSTQLAYDLFSNKDINEDGIRFSDLKKEFNKIVQATASGNFSTVPYLDGLKIDLINSNLKGLNRLALANTLYNQENIDKLFDMQINLEEIDYEAISVLIMHKNNQNSANQIKILREKAKEYGEEDLLQEIIEAYTPKKRKQETPMHLLEM